MKKRVILIVLLFLFRCFFSSAQNIHLDSLDLFIRRMMVDFDVPGLAVGIVRNDSILFSKGYGTREIHKQFPVDANTIFGIGSISKSFTALTLGMLVSEGKINWDDQVKNYLPYFELYDPYVTENFKVRDLLTHRSGLNEVSGGTLWYHSDLTRTDVIQRLKYIKPVSGFREKPAYQNVMYVVAGEIVSKVCGMPWDEFLQKRVFDKLDMKNSTSISEVRESNKNLAQPHIRDENFQNTTIIQEKGDNLAEAGFIYSSVNDMANYIRFLLNDGVFKGDTLISRQAIGEIFKPQIIYPLFSPPIHNEFTSYGFGWWLTPKDGHKIIEHSGGIDGM